MYMDRITALFHETNQMSLELHKNHNFTSRISQNIHRMIKISQAYLLSQTIQETLPPPGQKQIETHRTLRNGPKPNHLSTIHHQNERLQPRTKGICKNITTINSILHT